MCPRWSASPCPHDAVQHNGALIDAAGRFGAAPYFRHLYDHDVNVDVLTTFCDRYGVEVTREGVTLTTELFEGFECAR